MILILTFFDRSKHSESTKLYSLQFLIACIYIWSGIQKLNPVFIQSTFGWLISPFIDISNIPSGTLHIMGLGAAYLEMSIGFCLLTSRLKLLGIISSLGMHVFILFSLGPFGHTYNSVVWPWNIAMMCFVLILFLFSKHSFFFNPHLHVYKIVILFFGVLPFFSLFGMWDSYLSFALYTGNLTNGRIVMSSNVRNNVPSEIQKYSNAWEQETELNVFQWSMNEMNVPPYPEIRVYKHIAQKICAYDKTKTGVTLTMYKKTLPFSTNREIDTYRCQDL